MLLSMEPFVQGARVDRSFPSQKRLYFDKQGPSRKKETKAKTTRRKKEKKMNLQHLRRFIDSYALFEIAVKHVTDCHAQVKVSHVQRYCSSFENAIWYDEEITLWRNVNFHACVFTYILRFIQVSNIGHEVQIS